MSSTNTDKVYILKKDLPTLKAGSIGKYSKKDFAYKFYNEDANSYHYFQEEFIKGMPDWFELKQPAEDKRIEISEFKLQPFAGYGDNRKVYALVLSSEIPKDKYEAFKRAIERELNGEHKCVYCGCWTTQEDSLCYKNPNNTTPTPERRGDDTHVGINDVAINLLSNVGITITEFWEVSSEDDPVEAHKKLSEILKSKSTVEPISVKESAQKDWEITEVECYSGEIGRLVNGEYRIFDDGVGFTWEELSQMEGTKIKSVRRTSDGEVFTLGDCVVSPMAHMNKIYGFNVWDNGKLHVQLQDKSGMGYFIEDIQKQPKEEPKPILHISDDGVEMRKGDDEFIVDTISFEIAKLPSSEITNTEFRNNNKIFSTKEAAEEYILMNKPFLSVNDIKEAFKDTSVMCVHGSKIIQLAKSKINKQ